MLIASEQLAPRLERLVLQINLNLVGDEFVNFLKDMPSIERLSVRCVERHGNGVPSSRELLAHLLGRTGLRELEMSTCTPGPTIGDAMARIARSNGTAFPALEVLSLHGPASIGWQLAGPLATKLKRICLTVAGGTTLDDHMLALSQCHNVEELWFTFPAPWFLPWPPQPQCAWQPWLDRLAVGCPAMRMLSLFIPGVQISIGQLIYVLQQWRRLEVLESSCEVDGIMSMRGLCMLLSSNRGMHTFLMPRARVSLRELLEGGDKFIMDTVAVLTLNMDHFYDLVPEGFALAPPHTSAQQFIEAIQFYFPRLHHFTNLQNIHDTWRHLAGNAQYQRHSIQHHVGLFLGALQDEYRRRGWRLRDDVVFQPSMSVVQLMNKKDSERWRRAR